MKPGKALVDEDRHTPKHGLGAERRQIKVTLDYIEPPIWRRLVVPLTTTLSELHHILQAAMGWTDSHLHQFEIGGLRYGDLEMLYQDRFEGDAQAFDASEVRLRDFQFRFDDGPSFVYAYDFGDDWRHTVQIEKLLALKPAPKTATCIGAPARVRPRMSADHPATSNSCACC